MYTTEPEDHLTTRGLLYKVETKHDDSLRKEQKIHEMQIEDVKVSAELEEKKWRSCCFELHQESSLFFCQALSEHPSNSSLQLSIDHVRRL